MKKEHETIDSLLLRMSRIALMERGRLCRLRGRPDYNHQTWQDGRNVVRYVRRDQVRALQKAIEGYQLYRKLAEQYADRIIRRTRRTQHELDSPQNKQSPTARTTTPRRRNRKCVEQ